MADILLVEPNAVLAQTYAAALRGAGHSVRTVTHAQSAIHAIDHETPDCIVLELQLAAHSGIEFLYELRSYSEWQAIPVVICSHVPPHEFQASQRTLYEHLGVTTYLYKPRTNLARLLEAVEQLSRQPA